ncbi:glycoside hydrolase family 47 protein [Phycomyces blakesleeanus]|uniref:alpha-1,2-Mannosidase n=2 Tax=Phycomyces blakesleeanus TaxID=4837 RepID=A0A162Q361_PHYB8|nr:glycoside hydrolase family 47 protein [Phycomyces blakesleeanus NRRL 1555(-)]OAD79576.1 glycoside hydrolase family 47 protein [Phycomyces blakesleeanus NRRL 1555(-)]|eukprot:XP_018297616.1 glycoside hydrolase family 47 protein [Phycomyces blakesleeanus NRRL 1555(-)]
MRFLEWKSKGTGVLLMLTAVQAFDRSVFQQPMYANKSISNDSYRIRAQSPLPDATQLTQKEKQDFIKGAFMFAWEGYRAFSWGYDENRPVSNRPVNTRNGWGATIVDALDTLYLMGLTEQFNEAKDFVRTIDWKAVKPGNEEVQVFETVIRYVGGLISAYDLSGDSVFITKAVELVDLLMPAFDTPTGIPYQFVNFKTGKGVKSGFTDGASCLAELGTVQLEFTRLSQITDNWVYHRAGQRVYEAFENMRTSPHGLFTHLINPDTGKQLGNYITWGGMADSFYEYLIKQYVMSKGRDERMKDMSIAAIRSLEKHLLTSPKDHSERVLLSVLDNGVQVPVMDELACFAPGSLLLASKTIPGLKNIEDFAADLMDGCYIAWSSTRTGLAPETFGWEDSKDGHTVVGELTGRRKQLAEEAGVFPVTSSYILRPETLESLYYFYKYTGDKSYEIKAWNIFNALHVYSHSSSGFSGVQDIDSSYPTWDDRQESFFFAETFKYLYLFYDDDAAESVSFDQWVFNTEAHPFRIVDKEPPKPVEVPWFDEISDFFDKCLSFILGILFGWIGIIYKSIFG